MGLWFGEDAGARSVFPCRVASAGDERYLVCAACSPFVLVCDWFLDGVLQCLVRRVCVVLGCFGICGCRSHCNGCMIVGMFCCHVLLPCAYIHAGLQPGAAKCILVWLRGCCMGLALGRKPENDTLCFQCKVDAASDDGQLVRAAFAGPIVTMGNRFLLCVLQ